jgi:LuxR family maltose regulon positive regulatory protein
MQATEFAQTKIQPPRLRPGLVPRERLEGPLGDALARQRLVLLSAPAGFGKTAALTRQLAALPAGTALAWVSADADDDLGRFAACLFAALDPCDLPWRTAPEALVAALDGSRAARLQVAAELVNALLATELPRGLIVLEDAHRIEDPAVFEFLELVVERLPDRWGLVIASRVDPPLALARWRARGELAEFRQDMLRFTRDEVQRLVDSAAPAHAHDDARALLARTEGWAAGLRLVLGSLREPRAARGAGGQRHLFDYLASEVLDEMPERLRLFLLRCAVLPELSAARCAEVADEPDAARLLAEIEQRGLFVSVLDGPQAVLRLHDLFRDFLEDRLQRDRPAELPLLLQRAADGEADPVRRIGYLARAGAWDAAEALLAQLGPELVAAGAVAQVQRLIELFPPGRRASPTLDHLRGLCAWAHWDIAAMSAALERAARGFEAGGDPLAAQRSRVLEVIALTASGAVPRAMELLARVRPGPMDAPIETTVAQATSWHALAALRLAHVAAPLQRMVELLEASRSTMLWFQCVPPTAMIGLPGTRAPMQRYVDGALARTSADTPTPLRVLACTLQAGLQIWAGRLDAAAALLQQAEADCRWLNRPPNLIGHLHTYAALLHALRGEREAALAHADARLAGLLDDSRTSGRRAAWHKHFVFFKLRVAAILDDAATQREMARVLAEHEDPAEPPTLTKERITLPARLAALDGRWAEAAEGWAGALAAADEAIDFYGQAHELRMRLAHALLQLGRRDEAAAALAPVLARAQASGEPGSAPFAGPAALVALAAADWGARLDGAQIALLRRWAPQPPGVPLSPSAPAVPAMPAPSAAAPPIAATADAGALSQRELEVLERLAAGDSNKLIARAFELSPHTVKRHVANILDKLALESRGQAAAWYRMHTTR